MDIWVQCNRSSHRLIVNLSQSIDGNFTDISFGGLQSATTSDDPGQIFYGGSITVNGQRIFSTPMQQDAWGAHFVNNAAWPTDCAPGGSAGYSSVRVYHDAAGNAAISVYIDFDMRGTYGFHTYGGASANLPTIPRTSGISANSVTLGQTMGISVSRAAAGFTDSVTWQCGSQSGTIADRSGATQFTWVPSRELAAQAPNAGAADIVLTVTTYSGGTAIGSKSILVSCPIPEDMVPTVSAVLSDSKGYAERYGGYVQNQSQLRVICTAEGTYGSRITDYTVTCQELTQHTGDCIFGLAACGQTAVQVTVTDSRGRTAGWEEIISVTAWGKPTAAITGMQRCDADGNIDPAGAYAKITFRASISAVNQKNSARYFLQKRTRGGSQWTEAEIAAYRGEYAPADAFIVTAASTDTSFEFCIKASDSFATGQSTIGTIPVAFCLLDFNKADKAAGILQRASEANTIAFGADTKHYGHRITDVGAPRAWSDAVPLSSIYPVGSVYLSFAETSPADIFGGTWERIKDRFLLAAGDSYAAGTTGGESKHKLSESEMPSHTHGINFPTPNGDAWGFGIGGGWGGWSVAGNYENNNTYGRQSNQYTGGDGAHNNMPPYLTVYIWKRTA